MKKRKGIVMVVIAAMLFSALTAGYIVLADAGSSDDPLVSLSYLTGVFKQDVMSDVDKRIDAKISSLGGQSSASSDSYKAIQVSRGQTILGSEGAQIILRSGTAVSVCPGQNGLVDTTGGIDLPGNVTISPNHVYIIPREDGRGIRMTGDGYIMIKGGYKVVN
ncbi:MAG: hypothetical protein II705_01435 [Clostridia bacterium]|nr:hypothetical protein [Clostridia bacterium]MBQ4248680.1 hypothetical protein [Clostridia bacterium]